MSKRKKIGFSIFVILIVISLSVVAFFNLVFVPVLGIVESKNVNSYGVNLMVEINNYRNSKGLGSLEYSLDLEKSADLHAKDMVDSLKISHTGTDGSRVGARILKFTNRYRRIVGENIFYTDAKNIESIVKDNINGWIRSPSDNRILLLPRITETGVAKRYSISLDRWIVVANYGG